MAHVNILVTGAAGYIAQHCARKLSLAGHTLIGLDFNRPKNTTFYSAFQRGDCGRIASIQPILHASGIECILHCAGSNPLSDCTEAPVKHYYNDFVSTLFLLSCALENNIKKFIFLSSTDVYGWGSLTLSETKACAPVTTFGKLKLSVELLITSLAAAKPFQYAILRVSDILGLHPDVIVKPTFAPFFSEPSTLGPLAVPAPAIKLPTIEPETSNSSSSLYPLAPYYDFVHVEDVAQAVLCVLPKLNYATHLCYNIASGNSVSAEQFLRRIAAITHRQEEGFLRLLMEQEQAYSEMPQQKIATYRAQRELNWDLQHSDLDYMIGSTFDGLRRHG